jgi:hypothetical protein
MSGAVSGVTSRSMLERWESTQLGALDPGDGVTEPDVIALNLRRRV